MMLVVLMVGWEGEGGGVGDDVGVVGKESGGYVVVGVGWGGGRGGGGVDEYSGVGNGVVDDVVRDTGDGGGVPCC